MKDYVNLTDDEIVADIAEHIAAANTPPPMRATFDAAQQRYSEPLAYCRLDVLSTVAALVDAGEPDDRPVLLQLAAYELMMAAARTIQAYKQEAGEPLLPARFALVAYGIAAAQLASGIDPVPILAQMSRLNRALADPDGSDAIAIKHELDRKRGTLS